MPSRVRSAVIGALVFTGIGAGVVVALNAPEGLPFEPHDYRKVAFDDVGDLQVGNDVRVAQVRVGRVDDIELVGDRAVVTMQLDDVDAVYRNARAEVTSRSGLGQKYVELQPGTPSAGELPPHRVIAASRTEDSTDLLDLTQVFDRPTRAATSSALQQIGGGVTGHGSDLREFLTASPSMLNDLGTVTRALTTEDGRDLTSLLRSMHSLAGRFEGRQQQVSQLTSRLDTTLSAIAVDEGRALGRTLAAAPASLRSVRSALTDLRRPLQTTTSAMRHLRPGARSLAAATPDLRGFLRESREPLGRVPAVSEVAQPGLRELTGVLHDARPLAAKVPPATRAAQRPLTYMKPYAPEIAKWFSYASSALSDGDAAGHWLRFTLLPRTESVSGNAPMEDPTTTGDAYPEPGEAPGQESSPLPNRLRRYGGAR